ncbi:MAG: asparagine synthetase B family protein, partial [Planctomycetota bacterium]
KTIYKRARKLPAGHCLTLEFDGKRAKGEPRVRRWWDADFTPNTAFERPEEVLEELGPLFEKVVRDHLIADVPVGSFLSGGLDSTIVTTQAQQLLDTPLETFTIRFPRGKHDESTIAADNARALGLHAHVQDFDLEDLQERLPLGRELFDEPFGDHSFLPTLAVSELASKTMKVVLSGDGGDETHAGYGRYYKAEKRKRVNALADSVRFAEPLLRTTSLTKIASVRNAMEGPLGRLCHWYGGIPKSAKRQFCELLHPDLQDYDDYWLYAEHHREDFSSMGRQQYMDLKTTLPEAILTKVDRASMRCGLEVRPPLLDHRLVEFAASVPDHLKHANGEGKVLLRRVLDERLAAPNVNAGPKRGFSIPLDKFIREDGLFRQERDVVVADAFRIDAKKLAETLSLKRDA